MTKPAKHHPWNGPLNGSKPQRPPVAPRPAPVRRGPRSR
jgi:hypothetical protein